MSGLRAFHILEPLIQIRNAFFRGSSESYFETESIIYFVMIMAVINFFDVGQREVLLSLYEMFSMLLSILVCAAASLFFACLVYVQVSAPYAIADHKYELYTCLFRQMARLLLERPLCLSFPAQPAMILGCISVSWLFSLRLYCCPKYISPWTFSISTLLTYIGVLSTTITCVFAVIIVRQFYLTRRSFPG